MTRKRLRAHGINRLVDVRAIDEQALREAVGSMADWLKQLANGIDDRPVVADSEPKSSGSENTYPEDLTDIDTIRAELDEMARHAVAWLERQRSARADRDDQGSLLGLHHHHAQPHGRARAAMRRICPTRAVQLLEKTAAGQRPVRLLGVSVHNLCTPVEVQTESDSWLPFAE